MLDTNEPAVVRTAELSLAAAARRIPSNRGNKPVHPASLTRWIVRGVRLTDGSTLKLDARRYPGGWRVTSDALDEFVSRLTSDRIDGPSAAPPRSPAARRRADVAAARELDRRGIR